MELGREVVEAVVDVPTVPLRGVRIAAVESAGSPARFAATNAASTACASALIAVHSCWE